MKIRLRLRKENEIYFPEFLRYPWSKKWKPFLYVKNSDILPIVYTRKFSTQKEGEDFLEEKRKLGFWRFKYYDFE